MTDIRIAVVCQACKTKIKGDDGYLQVDWLKAMRACDALAEYRRAKDREFDPADELFVATTMAELVEAMKDHPDVPWTAFHRACDPDPDGNDYWIGADRLTTLAELLEWNDHLNEKNWVAHTTWNKMLANMTRATTRLVLDRG